MDKILEELDELYTLPKEECKEKVNNVLHQISKFEIKQEQKGHFKRLLIPKCYDLFDKNILPKDLFYFECLSNENAEVVREFLEYDKSYYVGNLKNPSFYYNYAVYNKNHWLLNLIKKKNINQSDLNPVFFNFILLYKCLNIHNQLKDLKNLEETVKCIDLSLLNEYWNQYIVKLVKNLEITKFIKSLDSTIQKGIFLKSLSENRLLSCIYTINLSNSNIWPNILHKLKENEINYTEDELKESEIFQAFMILSTLLHLHKLNDHNILENIKSEILSINNKNLLIQLLEDIYLLLFLKNDHYFGNETDPDGFKNGESEVRCILLLLKNVVDIIKTNNFFSKESELFTRFLTINKFLHDALWRLDLISNVKSVEKIRYDIHSYMLATPKSLIRMCLKKEDVIRARQVIEIFNLSDSEISRQVEFFEKRKDLSCNCNKFYRYKETSKMRSEIKNEPIKVLFQNFLDSIPKDINVENEKFLENTKDNLHYGCSNNLFFNVMDLLCTQSFNLEISDCLLKMAKEYYTLVENIESNYSIFCKKFLELSGKLVYEEKISVGDILTNPLIPLNVKEYDENKLFEKELILLYDEFQNSLNVSEDGVLNSSHSAHKIFFKINNLCNNFVINSGNPKKFESYLSRLFNYLKAFSKVLYIQQNSSEILSKGKNISYFEILNYNRSELMGKLLFENKLDPGEFESYFSKIKLDFLYHLIGNCFPTINLHVDENITPEELFPENYLYTPTANIIQYILKRNWLLALILKNMHNVEDVAIDVSDTRIQAFLNYVNLPRIQNLKPVFENNETVTSLHHEINIEKIRDFMDNKISKHNFSSQISYNSNDETVETGEEMDENIEATNWKDIYEVLSAIPEHGVIKMQEFEDLRDSVLEHIVCEQFEFEYYRYVGLISNQDKRVGMILENYQKWPAKFCTDVMRIEIGAFDRGCCLEKLRDGLQEVLFCEEVRSMVDAKTWNACRTEILQNKDQVFKSLLMTNKLDLIISFIDKYQPSLEYYRYMDENLFLNAFESRNDIENIKKLMDVLPVEHSTNICRKLLKRLRKIDHLKFLIEYLDKHNDDNLSSLKISLKMLSCFLDDELEQILPLIGKPLDIIEFLVMNIKFDKLAAILEVIRHDINHPDADDTVCVEKIDETLRSYAEKSLDFRVITQPNPRLLRTPEHKLMQSLDSFTLGADHKCFLMPEEVPLKDEWVPNQEVLDCMCCSQVTFSMFNRRHHCRRCGRVVCYNCSQKRMKVPSYGDILVRVCINCYEQTMGLSICSERSEISTRTGSYDLWLLTDVEEHNIILREEFSYDHAPSVSLCLSIMKFHSNSVEYPKFLLDQSNSMLKLLYPSQEPLQEIDYLLVVKMLKSLALAAKMKAQECSLQYGTSLADRLLSQADLLSLFAERGCLNLLPISNTSQVPYIDASVLRRLRDKLMETEQWNLALEVSTKAGLDNSGVFAAWGKSCLKAGCLTVAREKFQRCLDKNFYYETVSQSLPDIEITDETSSTTSRIRYSSRSSTLSNASENRPLKNPPLLNEIIHLLELKTTVIDKNIVEEITFQGLSESTISLDRSVSVWQQDKAVSILNKLRNLKAISKGYYFFPADKKVQASYASNRPIIDTVFYNECIYYLNRYGSYQSLLEFYVKHGELDQALQYILDNKMSTELFIEIYMRCLKDGIVNILQENMSKIDSTLDLWRDYLMHICRHLEKQNLLNSLYQLQLFMADYIRAAMTCIRFYQENISNFSDLSRKVNFLHKAEEHLKQLYEEDQWVEVASVRKFSTDSQDSYEEKSISNSLVMKINSKNIGTYINTIWRQNEVASFLSDCEAAGLKPMDTLAHILPEEDSGNEKNKVPTLFGNNLDKIRLAVLTISTAAEVKKGFKIASRIINDLKLRYRTIYCQTAKQLARNQKYDEIAELVSFIKEEHGSDKAIIEMCDEMLTLAVATLTKENIASETKVEDLIKLVSDKATKISAYIEAKQLKTAYFYAVRFKRLGDIKRILREAELNNQPNIKILCQKFLHSHAQNPSSSREKNVQ